MNWQQAIDQLSPTNKKMAEALIKQLAQQEGIELNGATDLNDPLENVPLWVAWMRSEGKSPRTIGLYEMMAVKYLKQDAHPTALSIQTYIAGHLKVVSAHGVNSLINALKSLFKYLRTYNLWNINPCTNLNLIKARHKEMKCPTEEQILTLLKQPKWPRGNDVKFKTMLYLLVNTGLRIDEACSLQRTFINLPALEITVIGKGNKERTIPVSPIVAGLLKMYMEQHPTDSIYVFTGKTSYGYWDDDAFRHTLAYACKRAGIERIKPHQLRHFFATKTLEHGAKLEVISKILGHANVGITVDVYRHIQKKEFHEEHEKHNPLEQLHVTPQLMEGKVIDGEFKEVNNGT